MSNTFPLYNKNIFNHNYNNMNYDESIEYNSDIEKMEYSDEESIPDSSQMDIQYDDTRSPNFVPMTINELMDVEDPSTVAPDLSSMVIDEVSEDNSMGDLHTPPINKNIPSQFTISPISSNENFYNISQVSIKDKMWMTKHVCGNN